MNATDTPDPSTQAPPVPERTSGEPPAAQPPAAPIGVTVTDVLSTESMPVEVPAVPPTSVAPPAEPAGEKAPEPPGEKTPGEKAPEPAKEKSAGEAAPEPAREKTVAAATEAPPAGPLAPASILTIDIGGTKVKFLATGQTEPRKAPSGKDFTPAKLVETVREMTRDWEYEAVSIGYPGLVGTHGPRSEPGNLGSGWVGFDFAAAFGKPVKMINDAAMQALGSYEGGRMLFLGLGTGLGSALITGNIIIPMELGRLPFDLERTLGQVLGRRGMEKLGKNAWNEVVTRTVTTLMASFVADYVVIGGGNAKHVKDLPPGARRGHNLTAFRGGFRVWNVEDVWVLAASGGESPQPTVKESLRML